MEILRKFLTAGHFILIVYLRPCPAAGHLDTATKPSNSASFSNKLTSECVFCRVTTRSFTYSTLTSSIVVKTAQDMLNLPLPRWKLFPAFMMADIRPLVTGEYDERSLSQLPLGCFCHFQCARLCPKTKIENWLQFSIFNFWFWFFNFRLLENRKAKPCHRLQHCRKNKIAARFHFSFYCWLD